MARNFPSEWSAITCYGAKENAKFIREALDDLGLKYHRDKDDKHYTRMMVVIPMPQFSYVFKFILEDTGIEINIYDTRPTHSGIYHHIDVNYITRSNVKTAKKVLKTFSKKFERRPYQFFVYERLRTGFLLPEFLVAKRKWTQMGVK